MSILLATDFSPEAAEAEGVAADLALALRTSVKLVHVLEANTTFPLGKSESIGDVDEARRLAAQDLLEKSVGRIEARGVSAMAEVLRGNVVSALLEEVLILPKQMVVVGGCGIDGKASHRGLAEDIAEALPAPVLVVRGGAEQLREGLKNRCLRVFVAIDRTQSSDEVIHWLRDLRGSVACDIHVGHYFWPPHEYERLGLDALGEPYAVSEPLRASLEREIRQRFSGLHGTGNLSIRCEPYLGAVSQVLLDAAHSTRPHLIVVGTHHRTRLGRFIHGSVSSDILRHSNASVVCVGPGVHRDRRPAALRHILVATDLSDPGNACVPRAYELLDEDCGNVTLLHVVSGPLDTIKQHQNRVDMLMLDTLQSSLRGLIPEYIDDTAIHTDVIVEDGGPVAERILQVAERVNADLIVLGANGKSAIDRMTAGSVATAVVHKSNRPIFVNRALPL